MGDDRSYDGGASSRSYGSSDDARGSVYRDADGNEFYRDEYGNFHPVSARGSGSNWGGAPAGEDVGQGYGQGQGYATPYQYSRGAVGFRSARDAADAAARSGSRPGDVHGSDGRRGGKGLTIAAIILMVVGVALIVVAIVTWLPHYLDYQKVHNANQDAAAAGVTSQTTTIDGVQTQVPLVDFDALRQINSEIVGWIQIPDTPINYAVPQHSDNDFYLDHSLDGEYNQYGNVFMDYASDPTLNDYNTVIYGHHLKNGEEFAKIADYSSQSEFDTISQLYYVTQDGVVHVLEPLCAMVVNGYDVDSIRTSFTDRQDFAQYVQSTMARSSAVTSRQVTSEITHLYMLSTCSYAQENDRTILVCVDASVFGDTSIGASSDAVNEIEQGMGEVTGVEGDDASTQNAEAGQATVTA